MVGALVRVTITMVNHYDQKRRTEFIWLRYLDSQSAEEN